MGKFSNFQSKIQLRVCRLLLKDERTPRAAKWMLGIAIMRSSVRGVAATPTAFARHE